MYRETYSEISLGDQSQARHREYHALNTVMTMLEKGEKAGVNSEAFADAVDKMENLWMIFMDDLSHSDNALPEDLRARLLSIGLWIVKQTSTIRLNGHADVKALIEINSIIRDGLR